MENDKPPLDRFKETTAHMRAMAESTVSVLSDPSFVLRLNNPPATPEKQPEENHETDHN